MNKSDVTLERMRSFVRVAERGSMSAVSRELGVGQSTITRHLRELEAAVGVSLLSRTTRRITMTEEGSRYYAKCVQILRLVEQAGQEVCSTCSAPAGAIRVSCPAALGVMQITRLMIEFQDQYPGIEVDLNLTDTQVDLVHAGVDVAIRMGRLTDSTMKLRSLGDSHRFLVAAPDYLDSHGRPDEPRDLSGMQGIRMSNVVGTDMLSLTGPDGREHRVPFGGRLRVDLGLAVREALLAGRGVAPAHHWLVDDLVAAGRLEPVLTDYSLPPVPVNMLIVPERADIARVRLLVEFLTERIATVPGIKRR